MVAITFAVPHESKQLCRMLRSAKSAGSRKWLTGEIAGREVIIAHTGIGTAAAEKGVSDLLAANRPDWLLSAGYAGALDPAIAHGELFVATNFTSSECLTLFNGRQGTLTTQQLVAETPAQKAALARETGAQAIDMETSAIARICGVHGVPILSLRAISDTAITGIPVPLAVSYDLTRQRPRLLALITFLAGKPSRILPFMRFVRGLVPARAAMTAAIVSILETGDASPSQ